MNIFVLRTQATTMTKNDRLILGILLGGICMFIAMTIFSLSRANEKSAKAGKELILKTDALKADPSHHRLIFENDSVRITQLILPPGKETSPHSHPQAIVWVIQNSTIVVSRFSDDKSKLLSRDTVLLRPDEVNVAHEEDAVKMHTIKNIGEVEYQQYRIELK